MTPELHRPFAIDLLGSAGADIVVDANTEECAALARRMKLPAVVALTCNFHLERDFGAMIMVRGRLFARVVQTCVISLEDFEADVAEQFTVRCVPEGEESDNPDPESLDEITYAHGVLDLGEAAAEQLALALDPYPRAPDAVLPEAEGEPDANPFAALTALKRPN
jgi:uncharacterized metal-binding protein YceD (DUF177 family)